MSIVESDARGFPEPPFSRGEEWGDGPAPYEPGEAPYRPGDRTPPQDMAAEQSVLGSMLLSKDAIADVAESLRGHDFYRPSHEIIHDAIIDLYGRGEPADPVTVAAELGRRGELERVGGAPYLHTLSANVPIAANAGYYAEIVREKAILRRLVEAGTKVVQMGYAGEGQVDEVVDSAQAEIYKVTDRRTSEDYAPLSDIMDGVLDEIEAIGNREAGLYGVPTGFADLDDLTNGLHSGQMIIVAARPAMGKALALDTPLPSPDGWTSMGEVRVGDRLFDAQGRPTTVVAATEVMHDRPCYEVTFSDGSVIVADAEHLWVTETRAARKSKWAAERHYNRVRNQRIFPAAVTTAEIASTLRVGADKRANHAVVNAAPLQGEPVLLPVAPYALGAWLGDGHSASARITCETPEIPMYLEACGLVVEPRGNMLYSIKLPERAANASSSTCPDCGNAYAGGVMCRDCRADHGSFQALLRTIGVLNNKHIPGGYLRASEAQRRELLAGLMDTDGTVVRGVGSCQFAVTDRRLADDVYELVVSLGYKCGRTTKRVAGRDEAHSTCYILNFSTTDDVFRLERKRILHKEERPATTVRIGRRYITQVRPIPSVPVRCVQVDNDEALYLAGRSMIPTHNSTLALDFCRAASIHNNMASVFFSLEMTRSEITMRLLSAEAKVPLNHIRNGQMNDDDWSKLARKMGEVSSAPMFIDDSPNMTMMEIRSKARRLKQRHDLRLVVIDYMQLMTSGKKVESRQLEVSEFSRQIKLLAKELEVPIIALSQLNRGPEQRSDKRPMLADLRESGCVTAETRLMRADTNVEVTIGELMESGARDIPVWALDDRLKLVPRTLTHAFPSGTKPVYELTLASGRRVQATANHPFLTYDGWMPLGELAVGARVGSVRHVPPPLRHETRSAAEIVAAARAARDLGVLGVPEWVPSLRKQDLALFLRELWAVAGLVTWDPQQVTGHIAYAANTRQLADDVAALLARFNVFSRIRRVRRSGFRSNWRVDVDGSETQLRFLDRVGLPDVHLVSGAELVHQLKARRADVVAQVPGQVWFSVRDVLMGEIKDAEPLTVGAVLQTTTLEELVESARPSRQRMAKVADVLGDADLEVLATNDVFWDTITAIDPLGEQPVFDATVMGLHNFVANGIALHNSLEQDADMVVLLHRDDAYERESTRPGEADLIIAKHRNGPTRDITVAFQGHYSRFVDMAH